MENRIKLYVVDPSSSFIDQLEGLFFENRQLGIDVIGSATGVANFEADKEKLPQADVFIIAANYPDGTGIKLIEFLKGNGVTKDKPIIFTVDKQTLNSVNLVKGKGVAETFQKPFSINLLIESIKKLGTTPPPSPAPVEENIMGSSNEEEKMVAAILNGGVENVDVAVDEDKRFKKIENNPLLNLDKNKSDDQGKMTYNPSAKKVVAFTSVSSSGKTSLLINTAYAIKKYAKNNPTVCIVDLNLLFPGVQFYFLNSELTKAQRDIYDISEDLNYLNEDLIKSSLIYHEESDLYIMNTPFESEYIHKISSIRSEHIERILVHLRDLFDVILIDTPQTITEDVALFPVQFADQNIVVMEPNFLNVVGVNKYFYVLKQLEENLKEEILDKTSIVLNKETSDESIYSATTKDYLFNKQFIARIPRDKAFVKFGSKGEFVVDAPTPASNAVYELAAALYPLKPLSPMVSNGLMDKIKGLFGGKKKK